MSKTTQLICTECTKEFFRPTKEVTRRRKVGKTVFYCSRSCSGKNNTKHLRHYEGYLFKNAPSEKRREWSQLGVLARHGPPNKFRKVISRIKTRIHDAGQKIPQDLVTVEQIEMTWNEQNGRCALSGLPMKLRAKDVSYFEQASLDRIDSDKGYVHGNVQWVLLPLNYAKNASNDEEFRQFLKLLTIGV